MNADDAWDALNRALQNVAPACGGQALFTADRLSEEQRARCAAFCTACPVRDLCGAYAIAAKVTSGFWAGHSYSPRGKSTAPGGSRSLKEGQDK